MHWLNTDRSNSELLSYISERYRRLIELRLISDPIGAEAAYFCFVELPVPKEDLIVMDQVFFDANHLPNFARFNLILPPTMRRSPVGLPGAQVLHRLAGRQGTIPGWSAGRARLTLNQD
jgi:hypothetical protein